MGEMNYSLSAGNYIVTVTDLLGCQATSTFELSNASDISTSQNEYLCEGDVFTINGENYFSDTIICTLNLLQNGCDSTHCITLEFTPTIYTYKNESICTGDSYTFNNNVLVNDTIIENIYTAANGCDSVIVFSLSTFDVSEINFQQSGSLCGSGVVNLSTGGFSSYSWSNGENTQSVIITSEGEYEVSVTDNNGCEAVNNIFIGEEE